MRSCPPFSWNSPGLSCTQCRSLTSGSRDSPVVVSVAPSPAVTRTDPISALTRVSSEELVRVERYSPSYGVTSARETERDRKSTRLNSSHVKISYAVFCLKKKKRRHRQLDDKPILLIR